MNDEVGTEQLSVATQSLSSFCHTFPRTSFPPRNGKRVPWKPGETEPSAKRASSRMFRARPQKEERTAPSARSPKRTSERNRASALIDAHRRRKRTKPPAENTHSFFLMSRVLRLACRDQTFRIIQLFMYLNRIHKPGTNPNVNAITTEIEGRFITPNKCNR